MKIAIIILGPPGSGKGTQAQLLADKLNLIHFDTGRYIRGLLYDAEFKNNKIIKKERELNETGKLNTTAWVLKIINQKIKEIDRVSKGVVLSGSPRTLFEAFGPSPLLNMTLSETNSSKDFVSKSSKGEGGVIDILERDYSKKNIIIFALNISEEASVKRNTHRLICSVCRLSVLNLPAYRDIKMSQCPFCGGNLKHRFDDKKEVVRKRLEEYKIQTQPIIEEFKKRKYKVINIDASPLPYKIYEKIIAHL